MLPWTDDGPINSRSADTGTTDLIRDSPLVVLFVCKRKRRNKNETQQALTPQRMSHAAVARLLSQSDVPSICLHSHFDQVGGRRQCLCTRQNGRFGQRRARTGLGSPTDVRRTCCCFRSAAARQVALDEPSLDGRRLVIQRRKETRTRGL